MNAIKIVDLQILKRFSFYILLFIVFISGCKKEEDLVPEEEIPQEVLEINKFIYENMSVYYLWENLMPNLDYTKQPDSYDYFDTLLYKPTDRWSFITNDYESLNNSYQGVEESMGHSFSLFWKDETKTEIVGVIEFVYINTPASEAGLKRGDIFTAINGINLNVDNYSSLLSQTSYTLTIYTQSGSKNINLTARVINENPILFYDTIKTNGLTIGYLAYKNFMYNYNDSISEIFKWLKSTGITEMILDLRYNNGGYVTAMQHLASILAPIQQVNNKNIIIEDHYNEQLSAYYKTKGESMTTLFKDVGLNLNFKRIFIITGNNTASASEALIIGLTPYMNVVTIGEQTHGKYTGAYLIYDTEKKHNWAIQPIVSKYSNSVGFTDFPDGLTPTFTGEDDLFHNLGSPDEELIALALEKIIGFPAVASTKSVQLKFGSYLQSYDSDLPRKNIPVLKDINIKME